MMSLLTVRPAEKNMTLNMIIILPFGSLKNNKRWVNVTEETCSPWHIPAVLVGVSQPVGQLTVFTPQRQ